MKKAGYLIALLLAFWHLPGLAASSCTTANLRMPAPATPYICKRAVFVGSPILRH